MRLSQEQKLHCLEHRQQEHTSCEMWEPRCRKQQDISPQVWKWRVCATCLHQPNDEQAKKEREELVMTMLSFQYAQDLAAG